MNVASDEIAFSRASWQSNPAPQVSSQVSPSALHLNPVLRTVGDGVTVRDGVRGGVGDGVMLHPRQSVCWYAEELPHQFEDEHH